MGDEIATPVDRGHGKELTGVQAESVPMHERVSGADAEYGMDFRSVWVSRPQ
jgi:hypothetical protein